jgi:hypothetical protein
LPALLGRSRRRRGGSLIERASDRFRQQASRFSPLHRVRRRIKLQSCMSVGVCCPLEQLDLRSASTTPQPIRNALVKAAPCAGAGQHGSRRARGLTRNFQATWRFSLRAVEGSVDFRSPCSLRMGERRLLSGQRPDGASDGDASPSRVDQRDCPSAKLPPGLDGAHGGDGSAAARTNAVA